MALVAQGFTGYITVADNGNDRSTKSYNLRADTYNEAVTAMSTIVTALGNVSDSAIVGYGVTHVYAEDAFTVPTSAAVQNEMQALLSVSIDGQPLKSATITIPAPKAGLFVATSGSGANTIDTTDAAVNAYVDLFKATGEAYVSDTEDAGALKEGRRIHRGSRKG